MDPQQRNRELERSGGGSEPDGSFGQTMAAGLLLAPLIYLLGLHLWLAGQLSGLLTGNGWPDSSLGDVLRVLVGFALYPGDPARAWPPAATADIGPAWLVYFVLVILLSPMAYGLVRLVRLAMNWRRRREFRRLRLGFASGLEIRRTLSAAAVAKKAKSVRPSFKGKKQIDPLDVGFYLGRDIRSRQKLYSSAEDVFIILAPPRQGKDVHFCTPYTIDAPGPCIVTSTRADAFTNTYAARAELGQVYVFDPNGMTNWPEKLRWSPILGCEDALTAANRAVAFVSGTGMEPIGESAFGVLLGTTILRCYLHAAALGRRTMKDVMRWSTQPGNLEPVDILRQGEAEGRAVPGWAGELESCVAIDPVKRAIRWSLVVTALGCFSDPGVLDACSPGPDDIFDLDSFLSGRNTLYVLGKEKKNASVAPVVTAMMEDMFDGARKAASRMPGSRLDPPLTVELNEAAHIAPLPNLPGYMGDSGGFSIALHVYLQSLSQARARWGEDEAMIMWDNAAVRVIMGGAGNVQDLEEISRLMGQIREKKTTRTYAPNGRNRGDAIYEEWRPVLRAEEIRTLEFGTAVVVARANRPVEVRLTPWWGRKDGKKIAAGKARTEGLIVKYSEEAEARKKASSAL
jgi:type IV secretory pathway TraG/TraD family ATPase VirD4